MMRLTPGGPFDAERVLPPEVEKNLLAHFNLDLPLHEQFFLYIWRLLHFDFGPSFTVVDFDVADLILSSFPVSLQLGGIAILIAIFIGCPLGAYAAYNQNSVKDYSIMGFSVLGIVIPTFVSAPLFTLFFGVTLKWLPVQGWNDGAWNHLILPITSLSLPYIGIMARIMRSSMIEVLNSQYIRTAKAKGLNSQIVLFRHGLRAAILPVVSYLGPAIAGIITGSVVIERVYALPGLGRYFVDYALNRDYQVVMGVVVFFGTLIVLMNLLVDIAYRFIDPKIGD